MLIFVIFISFYKFLTSLTSTTTTLTTILTATGRVYNNGGGGDVDDYNDDEGNRSDLCWSPMPHDSLSTETRK